MKNFTQNLFFVALLLFGTTIYAQESSDDDSMDLEELEEVLLVGGGVIDLAEDRKTPVAATTIKADEIQKKIGTQDISAILVNSPSIYVSSQMTGYGSSRMFVRGFEDDNTAFLINGQPINSQEDGRMYYSNWSGMSDIANVIQIQRGLGASKLAISSVGGTVNFVMKSAEKNQGGFIYQGFANDNYLKSTVSYDTGMNENGWATSLLLSHWQGDGYAEGTYGEGQTYFVSIGYKANDKHSFNFLVTGAPQNHDEQFSQSLQSFIDKGIKFNDNIGYVGNVYKTEETNFYHKPVLNLSWDYNINDKSSLSTVIYASTGNGGGTGGRGVEPRTAEGYIDYDAIYQMNSEVPNGAGYYFGDYDNYITRASMNMHQWVGLVSNYERQLSENLTLNVGVDLRTYYGEHFRVVTDFHGLSSWSEGVRLKDHINNHQSLGSFGTYKETYTEYSQDVNGWAATFANVDEYDKIAYSNDERITYGGLFTQIEYANDTFSAFFQGSVSNQYHQRFDHMTYADEALLDGSSPQWNGTELPDYLTPGTDSEKADNFGFNAKAGFGYEVHDNAKVYVNVGYYDRQPYHDNMYLDYTNQLNPNTSNETILGLEAGYSYSVPNFTTNINVYRTSWADRVTSSFDETDAGTLEFTLNEAVEQLHQGIEIDFIAQPQPEVPYTVRGFVGLGDWEYVGNSIERVVDEDRNVISVSENDIDGGKVGGAAQFTAGIGLDIQIAERFSFDTDLRFYDNLYAERTVKNNLELPNYNLADMGLSYKMLLDSGSLDIRVNIKNVFDMRYIEYLNTVDGDSGVFYNGIDTANEGQFGLGRTWSVGMRYNF